MAQEAVRWTIYGIVVVTVFIVSMIFTDTCIDMVRRQREKSLHSRRHTCYTNSKRPDSDRGVQSEEG